jgi:hypothetical protein
MMASGESSPGTGSPPLEAYDWSPWLTVPIVAAILGGLVYGALHLAAEEFYGPFGVTPEDAGLDRVTLLVRATAGEAYVVFFIGLGLVAMRRAGRKRRELGKYSRIDDKLGLGSAGPRDALLLTLLVAVPMLFLVLHDSAGDSRSARLGHPTHELLGIDPYPYRATIADLHWRPGAPPVLSRIRCGLVIGETGSYELVYVAHVGTFRVTPDEAVVVVHPQSDSHC